MKKIILILSMVICLSLCSCKKTPTVTPTEDPVTPPVVLSDFQKITNIVYDSEEALDGYTECQTIKNNDVLVYSKDVVLSVSRTDSSVDTEYSETVKKLDSKGEGLLETKSSYKTIGTTKYQTINGKEYETTYEVPTYFLTFVISEEFLEEGYILEVNGNNYNLSGTVKSNQVSSMFLNKSFSTIGNLNILLKITDSKLTKFEVSYVSTTNLNVTITYEYTYNN